MKSQGKKVVRNYFLICCILGFLLISLWLIVCFKIQNDIVKIVFLLFSLLVLRFAIRITADKTILTVLFDQLEAFEFQKIINDNRFISPLTYRVNAAISTGDYQTVVNIVTTQMQKKRCSIRAKYSYLCILALTYFELRDFEKLQTLITKYDEYKVSYPSKSFLRSSNSTWNYYKYFLEQNYEACKAVCKERGLELNPKAWNTKIIKLQNDFLCAVACYENGELDEAKKFFENIIAFAPRMNHATLSQKYLVAIKQGQPISLDNVAIIPDSNYRIYDTKTEAKIRNYRLIIRVGVVIVAAFLIASSVLSSLGRRKNSDISIFDKNLSRAVIQHYEDATVLDYFNLYKDETFVDSLGLIVENDCIHLIEIVSIDNGQTINISLIEENIELDKYYCEKSPASNYYIGFVLSQTAIIDTDTYCIRELTIKHNNFRLIIDYIETVQRDRGTVLLC